MGLISIDDFPRQDFSEISMRWGIPLVVVTIAWGLTLHYAFNFRPFLTRKYKIANFLKADIGSFQVKVIEIVWWVFYVLPFLLCIGSGLDTIITIKYIALGIDLMISPSSLMILFLGFLNFHNNGYKISKSVKISIGVAALLFLTLTFIGVFFRDEKSWMAGGFLIIFPCLVFYGFYRCYKREKFILEKMMEIPKSDSSVSNFINDISNKNYENWIEGGRFTPRHIKWIWLGISLAISAGSSLLFVFYFKDVAAQRSATISTAVGSFLIDFSILIIITNSISNINNTLLLFIGFAIKAVSISFSSRFWMAGHGFIFFFIGVFFLTRVLIYLFMYFYKIDTDFGGIDNIDEDVRKEITNMNTNVNHVTTKEFIISAILYLCFLIGVLIELFVVDLEGLETIVLTEDYAISQRDILIGFIILSITMSFTIGLWLIDSNNFEMANVSSLPPIVNIICIIVVWIFFILVIDLKSGDLWVYGASLYSILSSYFVSRRILNVHSREEIIVTLTVGHYIYGIIAILVLASLAALIAIPIIGQTRFLGGFVASLTMSVLSFYSYFLEEREADTRKAFYEWFWRITCIVSWISFLVFSIITFSPVFIGIGIFLALLWICSIIWQCSLISKNNLIIEKTNMLFLVCPACLVVIIGLLLFIIHPLPACIVFFFGVLVLFISAYLYVKEHLQDLPVFKFTPSILLIVLILIEIGDLVLFILVAKSTFIGLTSICMIVFIVSMFYLLMNVMSSEKTGRIIYTNIFFPARKLKNGDIKSLPYFGFAAAMAFSAPWLWGVFSSIFFIYPWFGILSQVSSYCIILFFVFGLLIDFDTGAIQALSIVDSKALEYCTTKAVSAVGTSLQGESQEVEVVDYESFILWVDRRTEENKSRSLFASSLRGQLFITSEVNFDVVIDSIRNYLKSKNALWHYLDNSKKYTMKERIALIKIFRSIDGLSETGARKETVIKYDNYVEQQNEKRMLLQDEVLKTLSNEYAKVCSTLYGKKYEDKNFYPHKKYQDDDSNIFKGCKWDRAENYLTGAFMKETDASDIQQGFIGDCYLISSLAAISKNPGVVENIFENPILKDNGVFSVKFKMFGQTAHVVVDSKLPFKGGKLYCATPSDKSRSPWWFTMVEKAWAKLNGSYTAIDGGQCHRALTLFDNGQPMQYVFEDDRTREMIASGNLWNLMLKISKNNGYLCAGSNSGQDTEKNEHGVVLGHAYTILQVAETHNFRLIKLRNPWGEGEWNGDWSDSSPLWERNKSVKDELGYENKDDGEFWMSFKDFLTNFRTLYVLDKMVGMFGVTISSSFKSGPNDGANPYSNDKPDLTHVQNYLVRVTKPTTLHCLLERSGAQTKIRAIMCYINGKLIDRMWKGVKSCADFVPGNWPMESFNWKIDDYRSPWTLALTRDPDPKESSFILHIWTDCPITVDAVLMNEEMPENTIIYTVDNGSSEILHTF